MNLIIIIKIRIGKNLSFSFMGDTIKELMKRYEI